MVHIFFNHYKLAVEKEHHQPFSIKIASLGVHLFKHPSTTFLYFVCTYIRKLSIFDEQKL